LSSVDYLFLYLFIFLPVTYKLKIQCTRRVVWWMGSVGCTKLHKIELKTDITSLTFLHT